MKVPRVTVSILNYQRKDTLRMVLERSLAQGYPGLDFVVVDNGSTDGSDRMVQREFPSLRLVRLPRNIGCAARNAGVAAAKGEIVVTIDNDVLLASPEEVQRAVEAFERYPKAACVNFKILDRRGNLSRRDWCHPRDWRRFANEEFLTDYVLEGASAFRREAFERVGGYWAPLFLGHEGVDLALRLLDAGFDLVYSPHVKVTHLVSSEARPPSRIYYTFTRNSLWVALRNHRPVPAAGTIAKDLMLMAFSSGRARQLRSYFRGVRDGIKGAGCAVESRRPIGRSTYRRLREVRMLQPSLWDKVKSHWRDRPI